MFRAPAFCVLGAEILNLFQIPLQNPCICWRTPAFGGTFCPDVLYLDLIFPGKGRAPACEERKDFGMKIVLVGGGKVGAALARQLSEEGHNVTVVDTNKARVEHIGESYDVMSILGNGSSITTLSEAGVEDADVFIAVTGSDELNLLCCMFAKKAGHCHAIARVRNPSYSHELDFIKKQIGISAIINPEMAAAKEISHLLRFPGASKIDTFADGRVRLIKFALTAEQGLDGVAIREIPTRLKSDILVLSLIHI